MNNKPKIIRACTVPQSLGFVKGLIPDLQKEYEIVLLSSPGAEWASIRMEYSEVKCVEVPMVRRISLANDMKSLFRLIRVFRKEKPVMVHSMTPKAGMLCMMASWWTRVPVRIHTFTGLVFPTATGLKRRILMLTDWITCACATHIIPEGEGVKRDLLDNHITRKPIRVLGYGNVKGIDLDRFDRTDVVMAEAAKLRKEDRLTFVFVGRLLGDKGVNELVEAFVMLQQDYEYVRLVLVGPDEQQLDPLKPETMRVVTENPEIEAVGSQRDVRPYYAMADVAVLPSYREGFPNCVIEAGAMGLPQIVTDINGCREIIIEGENGTIVPSKDADSLYRAMKRMVEEEAFRKHCANNARQMIASRYEQGYVRQCLYDYYHEIMEF